MRVTRQRSTIRELFGEVDEFRTAQQVHEQLRSRGETIGLATVYRTLQSMTESGELDAVRQPEGEVAYRRCEGTGHHHHLICRNCGRAVEITGDHIEEWADRIAAQHGFRDAGHELEIYGLCDQC